MNTNQNLEVGIVEGSIAGLSAGITLNCIGWHVHIFEQSPAMLRSYGTESSLMIFDDARTAEILRP